VGVDIAVGVGASLGVGVGGGVGVRVYDVCVLIDLCRFLRLPAGIYVCVGGGACVCVFLYVYEVVCVRA